jgi:hypothetical protein
MHSLASRTGSTPLFRWPAVLLGMLSLSIGWGIRGDCGHECGATMPGLIWAVVVCLFSCHHGWRELMLFFAFFGSIGREIGGRNLRFGLEADWRTAPLRGDRMHP